MDWWGLEPQAFPQSLYMSEFSRCQRDDLPTDLPALKLGLEIVIHKVIKILLWS